MPTYDIKPLFTPAIDKFLSELSAEAKNKLWKVVNALRLEFELSGSTKFKIPFDKLKRNKSSDEDARAVLINLHNNNILKVSSKLKIGYKPDRFSIKTIKEEPNIYLFPNTEIELEKDKFIYLEARLRSIVHPKLTTDNLFKIEESFKNNKCTIKKLALELIAKKIDSIESLRSNLKMGDFLGECEVNKDFYEYITTLNYMYESVKTNSAYITLSKYSRSILGVVSSREQLLYKILAYYSCSKESAKNKKILFKIIEHSTHPLLFNADKIKANKLKNELNNILEFDGYAIENDKVKILKNKKVSIPYQEEKSTYLDSGFDHNLIRNSETPTEKHLSVIRELLENKNIEKVSASAIEKTQSKKNEKQQPSTDLLFIQLGKHKLEANKNTGAIKLNKCSKNLNPESQEFKTLIKLMTNKDYKATYKELLGDNPTKVNKRNLTFIIRNLKEVLGILPAKNAKNKDIIKNIKNHGYMIGL